MAYRGYRQSWYYFRAARPDRPHEIHWLEYDPHQQRVRCTRSFPSRPLALRFQRIKDKELNEPLFPELRRDWETVVREFAASMHDASRAHRSDLGRTLRRFREICAPQNLAAITPTMVDHYFARRAAGDPPPAEDERRGRWTVYQRRKEFGNLHSFLEWCVTRGYLSSNPMQRMKRPRLPATIVDVPSDEQWVNLLRVLELPRVGLADPQAWHLYILLAVVTGLDQHDLLRVRTTNPPLDLGGAHTGGLGLLRWTRDKAGRRDTPGREIVHGLPTVVCDRLAVRIAELQGHTHLFPWRLFQRKQWLRITAAAGFEFPFKSLRKAFGTKQAEGQALASAAQGLGHSSPRVTSAHYVAHARVALALASQLQLPELPPLPSFRGPAESPEIRARPPGRNG